MLFLSTLAFSLFSISNAVSQRRTLGKNVDLPGRSLIPRDTSAIGPVGELQVSNGYVDPDGHSRSVVLVNGLFPGPPILADKNDELSIKLVNELTDGNMDLETSVHYHGIFQRKTNWADGTTSVTQCPVHPNETFVQTFETRGQTGTYWYHSHFATQYCDGLRGPLVIYDPDDPLADLYDVDNENTIITVTDWWHEPAALDHESFTYPNSTLINGKGRYAGGPQTPLAVVNVHQGLRYRFRIIGMSCDATFNFSIDGHRMTIIEADGEEVVPVDVDSIHVLAGQRYSVVVSADQPVGNYWIRTLTYEDEPTIEGDHAFAIFRYDGAPEEDPTSDPGPYELGFDERDLHALIHPGAPGIPELGKADVNIVLPIGFKSGKPHGNFTLGGVSFVEPSVPVLLQILNGDIDPSQLLPNGSVYPLPLNKVIEISFPHPDLAPGIPHPVHLHGHAFDVIRSIGSDETNFVDPVRRDTVSVGGHPKDNVTIRFVTDNAGPWFLHCHLDWHLAHGFAVVMAEATRLAEHQQAGAVPQDWKDLCKAPGY